MLCGTNYLLTMAQHEILLFADFVQTLFFTFFISSFFHIRTHWFSCSFPVSITYWTSFQNDTSNTFDNK